MKDFEFIFKEDMITVSSVGHRKGEEFPLSSS